MAHEEPNRAELARLAEMFRRFARETGDPEFQQTFLRAAEDMERLARRDEEPGPA